MPLPSVDPNPFPVRLERFAVPDEAQEASYFAASARISSFVDNERLDICSLCVPIWQKSSPFAPFGRAIEAGLA